MSGSPARRSSRIRGWGRGALRHDRVALLGGGILAGGCLLASSCAKTQDADLRRGPPTAEAGKEGARTVLTVKSGAFTNNGEIPRQHTCQGSDSPPPLEWSGAPPGTKSFAIIVDDPDAPDPAAPKRTWVHWVVFDIPAGVTSLPSGGPLPSGAREGQNDWKRAGYGGPCPPVGRHRYFHKIYALDTTLGLEKPTKAALEQAMRGHILAQGELVGTYEKGQ